jgi:hypothetical protein
LRFIGRIPFTRPGLIDRNILGILVGGFNPSEKYYSVGTIIPNIWKNKTCSKPTY